MLYALLTAVAMKTALAQPVQPTCIKIGILTELSRKASGTSKPYGLDIVRGIEMAQSESAGLCPYVLDFGNSIANIPDLIRREAANGTHLFIGLGASDQVTAALPALKESQSLLFSPTASSNVIAEPDQRVVMLFPRNAIIAEALASGAIESGCRRTTIIYASNNVYSTDMKDSFERAFKKVGGKVDSPIQVRMGKADIEGHIGTLRKSGCVFVPLYEVDAARIISAFKKNKITKLIVGSDSWGTFLRIVKNLTGGLPFSIILPSIYSTQEGTARNREFVRQFEARYAGSQPSDLVAFSYDALRLTTVLLRVCEERQLLISPKNCLAKVLPLETLTGPIESATELSLDRRVNIKRLSRGD